MNPFLMRTKPYHFLAIAFFSAILFSCREEKEDLQVEKASDYVSLQAGKYITYRLDSLVFTQSGRAEEIHSYQEKHVIDAQITDNLGRPTYRVFRFLRELAGTQPWAPSGSYSITPAANSIEITEDNQRILKLTSPVAENTSWKGNRFLSTEPFAGRYNFSNDDNMADWDFLIESTNETLVLDGKTVNEVVTVTSIDESLNVPVTDAGSYAARTFSIDKFSKGLGIVYQQYIMWEYQPNQGGTPYKTGFGIKRSMIDHN